MILLLLRNELYKLFKKKKVYVLMSLLILGVILQAVLAYKYDYSKEVDWKASSEAQIEYFEELTENKELKDEDLKEILVQKKQIEYTLENNISSIFVVNYGSAVFGSVNVAFIIVVICSIVITSEIFSEDYTLKTIKLLFLRPNKRAEIWGAKVLASITILLVFSGIILVISMISNGFLYDIGQPNQYIVYTDVGGEVIKKAYATYIMQNYLSAIIEGVGYALLTGMCTILFKSAAAATMISLVCVLAINTAISFFEEKTVVIKYLLFYNNDWSQYVNAGTNYWETTLTFSIIITLSYYIAFLLIGYWKFCKQDIY